MRKLIATTMVSLDGVMQAPGGPEEDPTGGFTFTTCGPQAEPSEREIERRAKLACEAG